MLEMRCPKWNAMLSDLLSINQWPSWAEEEEEEEG